MISADVSCQFKSIACACWCSDWMSQDSQLLWPCKA